MASLRSRLTLVWTTDTVEQIQDFGNGGNELRDNLESCMQIVIATTDVIPGFTCNVQQNPGVEQASAEVTFRGAYGHLTSRKPNGSSAFDASKTALHHLGSHLKMDVLC